MLAMLNTDDMLGTLYHAIPKETRPSRRKRQTRKNPLPSMWRAIPFHCLSIRSRPQPGPTVSHLWGTCTGPVLMLPNTHCMYHAFLSPEGFASRRTSLCGPHFPRLHFCPGLCPYLDPSLYISTRSAPLLHMRGREMKEHLEKQKKRTRSKP